MPKDKLTDFDVIEIIEQEMISMWATGEIPHLLKNDPEFVKVITKMSVIITSILLENTMIYIYNY